MISIILRLFIIPRMPSIVCVWGNVVEKGPFMHSVRLRLLLHTSCRLSHRNGCDCPSENKAELLRHTHWEHGKGLACFLLLLFERNGLKVTDRKPISLWSSLMLESPASNRLANKAHLVRKLVYLLFIFVIYHGIIFRY